VLSLEPSAVDWTAATLELFDGVTTDQFNGSAVRMALPAVMDELIAWATATFIPTFAWSWARDTATGGAVVTLTCTGGTVTLEAKNATAELGYGLRAGAKSAAASHEFDGPGAATWAPLSGLMISADLRVLATGDACADGAIRPGSPGLAHRRPVVGAVGSALDAGRMAATMAAGASPRRATAWQTHTATWLTFALGDVTRAPAGALHYRWDLQAAGDVI